MYGPPTDPSQRLAPVEIFDAWEAYLFCAALGVVLSACAYFRRPAIGIRAALFIVGQVILLTAPLAFFIDTYVYGSFPTIDKAGSLAFYLEGVHARMMAHPIDAINDPAARLLGVHVGHLWVTELLDLAFTPMGAFNAQALLYPILGWWCTWWLFHETTHNPRVSMLMSFPFGMGLHLFRDLNWYTIERAAIFWVPLFLVVLMRAWKRGGRWVWAPGFVLVGSAWMNVYLGMINAGLLFLTIVVGLVCRVKGYRRLLRSGLIGVAALAPLAIWQWLIMAGGPALGNSDQFLWERAALDTFTLSPLRWDRLEPHRALNVVALAVAALGIWRRRWHGYVRFAVLAAAVFFLLALGPLITPDGPENFLYMATRAAVPGFWRVAKPEVFFHVTWLMLLGVAAVEAHQSEWSKRLTTLMYGVFVVGWVVMIRTHPAYPPMTMPLTEKLDPDWVQGVLEP